MNSQSGLFVLFLLLCLSHSSLCVSTRVSLCFSSGRFDPWMVPDSDPAFVFLQGTLGRAVSNYVAGIIQPPRTCGRHVNDIECGTHWDGWAAIEFDLVIVPVGGVWLH